MTTPIKPDHNRPGFVEVQFKCDGDTIEARVWPDNEVMIPWGPDFWGKAPREWVGLAISARDFKLL